MGEKFRLAGKRKSDRLKAFFGNGSGDNCCGIGFAEATGGFFQGIQRGLGGLAGGISEGSCGTISNHRIVETSR